MSLLTRVQSIPTPAPLAEPAWGTLGLQTYRFHADSLSQLLEMFFNHEFNFSSLKVLHHLRFSLPEVLLTLRLLAGRTRELVATVRGFNAMLAQLVWRKPVGRQFQLELDELIEVYLSHRVHYLVDDILNSLYEYNMQFDRAAPEATLPITEADLDAYSYVEATLSGRGTLRPSELAFLSQVVEELQRNQL